MSIEKLLWSLDATGLGELVRKGDVEPRELVDAAIARAEKVEPEINAIAEPLFERARALALKVDREAPFAGVPFALKDLGTVWSGVPIHNGSRVAPIVPDRDSIILRRYLDAGLVPIATTTTPEQGIRLMTESAAFGATRNPWDVSRTSGGSSGGASAIVAAGVVPAANASDGGGSIRVPAACTGLVGMKPSRDRVPIAPLMSQTWFGVFVQHVVTRSVRDSAALLDLSSGQADGVFAAAAASKPDRLRIGIYRRSPLGLDVAGEVQTALDAAASILRESGHEVEEVALDCLGRDFMADYCRLVCCSIAGNMRADAERLGRAPHGQLERATRIVARFGDLLSGGEIYAALQRLNAVSVRILEETDRFDAVLMPVIAHPPLPVGAMAPKGFDEFQEEMLDRLRLTRLLRIEAFFGQLMDKSLWFTHWPAIQNVTGQPAIALPVHTTDDGLPLGIQAVGRMGDEETLFSLAAQMERQSGWLERRAPLLAPAS